MASRRYQKSVDRQQFALFPVSLDDYVQEDNVVRAIDVYIDSLCLSDLGFKYADDRGLGRGQPAFYPGVLLKLYLYGYLNGIRSSRRLAKECQRNLEVLWLLEQQAPSYKTIANFRKDNAEPLVKVNRDFLLLCRSLDLVGGEIVAIDGSFFHGNASKGSIATRSKLTRQLKQLEQKIEHYHQQLNERDSLEETVQSESEQLQEALSKISTQKQRIDQQLSQLDESQETQISRTDPDARLLSKGGQRVAGYNVQSAVDEKHQLIVASEITHDGNDQHQLSPMALKAMAAMDADNLTVLADSGYFESEQIRQCIDHGITPYVPMPDKHASTRTEQRFTGRDFTFDTHLGYYRCPAGNPLRPTGNPSRKNDKLRQRYISKREDCNRCPLRDQCLSKQSQRRQIYRWEYEHYIDAHRQRMADSASQMKQRAALVEHPFGTLKHRAGWSHFLVRGFEKVRGEWSLMVLAYNLTRVLNIIGLGSFRRFCQYLIELQSSSAQRDGHCFGVISLLLTIWGILSASSQPQASIYRLDGILS